MHLESIVCLVIAVVAIILWLREKCRTFGLTIQLKALEDTADFVVKSATNVADHGAAMVDFGFLLHDNEEDWRSRYTLWFARRFLRDTKGLSAVVEHRELAVGKSEQRLLHYFPIRSNED